MNLKDFAQSILLSGSFEQKLAAPDSFTDEAPGTFFEPPALPTRSHALRFHQDASGHARTTFPTETSLNSEEARAKVFHAFANHELLAMELMALAILKFPEAPKPFRMGLAHCLKEEQSHLKLYLRRMRELGVEFGSFPVNGFFWNVLRNMKSPLEFTVGMSLTFEQANLDFSNHYMTLFKKLGDRASSEIMGQVFKEEVGHVKFGVQWLEKWRPTSESQWDFYCEHLTLPLTPQRAKGTRFSAKNREGTGLTVDFLEKLEGYSHSKGRPPRVFIFNSSCELEWASFLKKQASFQAPKFQEQIASDLASLMMFLGHGEDIVALPVPPSLTMIRQWREWGISTPNFVQYSEKDPSLLERELKTFKIQSFEPWGWSPTIVEKLSPFEKSLLKTKIGWPPLRPGVWPGLALCYQKTSVPPLLAKCLKAHPHWSETSCSISEVGKVCDSVETTLEEIQNLLKENQPVVLKAPLGASGFNMIRVLKFPPEEQQLGWIQNILTSQGHLVVEKWFHRVADFSMQIEVGKRVEYLGFTRLLSDNRGQYAGHRVGGKLDDLPEEVRKVFYQGVEGQLPVIEILEHAAQFTGQWLAEQGFQGAAGIDAFVYRCKQTGRLRVKPIVEVNARYTMGRIALELEKHLCTGTSGEWLHMSKQRLAKLGFNDWNSWLTDLTAKFPQKVIHSQLKSGVFPTNDPGTAQSFLSVLVVSS